MLAAGLCYSTDSKKDGALLCLAILQYLTLRLKYLKFSLQALCPGIPRKAWWEKYRALPQPPMLPPVHSSASDKYSTPNHGELLTQITTIVSAMGSHLFKADPNEF
jgi:hypothetical protein